MDVKNKIMISFFQLLEQGSFKEINVRQIMKKADLTRTLFYQYFDSKEDLARLALEDQLSEIVEYMQSAFSNGRDKEQYLQETLAGVKVVLNQQPNFEMLLEIQEPSFNLLDEFKTDIKAIILKKIKQEHPNSDSHNLDYYAELYTVSMLTTLQWYFSQKDFPLEKLVEYIQTCVFDGLAKVLIL